MFPFKAKRKKDIVELLNPMQTSAPNIKPTNCAILNQFKTYKCLLFQIKGFKNQIMDLNIDFKPITALIRLLYYDLIQINILIIIYPNF